MEKCMVWCVTIKCLSRIPALGNSSKHESFIRCTDGLLTYSLLFLWQQHSSYTLVVKASDRDGAADGISSLCSCNVKVIDVNDNFPTLAQSSVSFNNKSSNTDFKPYLKALLITEPILTHRELSHLHVPQDLQGCSLEACVKYNPSLCNNSVNIQIDYFCIQRCQFWHCQDRLLCVQRNPAI